MNSTLKQSKCTCCKKSGHNITTCSSAVRQGILIENHIIGMQENSTSEMKFRIRLLQYLRNLSITQQKILCTRIGETRLSYSTIMRYLSYKWKSRKVMHKIYSKTDKTDKTDVFVFTDRIISPSSSEKPERKKYIL
jgi:hypothetical protein